jgi:Spy/CpxP family protein refolding chaperone
VCCPRTRQPDVLKAGGRTNVPALRGERHALRELLSKDTPDHDAAMLQIERVGVAETALEKRRISTMLEIRQLPTPAQRAELVKVFRERQAEREQRQRAERH